MLCVTMTMVLVGNRWPSQSSSSSPRRFSEVSTSSALNGSSISSAAGLHDQRPGEADPLPHAAGQLLRIGGLVAVQAHQVDRAQRPLGPLGRRHPPRLQADLHVLLHGQPGQQREGLEHHGGFPVGAGQPLAAEQHLAVGRRDQAGDAPQQGRLAAAAAAEQRDELALVDGQRDAVEHRHRAAVRPGERLAQRLDADQRPGHASAYFDSAMLYSRRHSSAFSPVT